MIDPREKTRKVAFRAAKVALVAFHGWLLFQRLADWSIFEPAVLAKWGGAMALVGATLLFQRFVPRRARGMRAVVVFWLLVLLLHVAPFAGGSGPQLDAEVVQLVQLALVVPAVLAAAFLTANALRLRMRAELAFRFAPVPIRRANVRTRFAPRSPPLS